MAKKLETTKTEFGTYVDEDGVIQTKIESQVLTTTRVVQNYDEFIMVYLKDMSSFLSLENATQLKLVALIWRDIAYCPPDTNVGNEIYILKDRKEKWAGELNVKLASLANAITILVQKDILRKKARGLYQLNESLFFKGRASDRKRIMEKRFQYEVGADSFIKNDEE